MICILIAAVVNSARARFDSRIGSGDVVRNLIELQLIPIDVLYLNVKC